MNNTLSLVTLLSLAMSSILSVIVWRLLREERHRSDARVAALTEKAVGRTRPALPPRRARVDLPLHVPATAATVTPSIQPLFVERRVTSPWPARLGVAAGLFLLAAAAILASRHATAAATASRPVAAAAPASFPPHVELLGLRDSHEGLALTITGLVRNPAGSVRLEHLSVIANAFDATGSFVAAGRAAIDVPSLAPGDESSFTIAIPGASTVARYRITFRSQDGSVVAHVDRRQQMTVALNGQ